MPRAATAGMCWFCAHSTRGFEAMIHFSSTSKQYGPQVLFQNASFQILPGSRGGLVGHVILAGLSLFTFVFALAERTNRAVMADQKRYKGKKSKTPPSSCAAVSPLAIPAHDVGVAAQDVGKRTGFIGREVFKAEARRYRADERVLRHEYTDWRLGC